MSPKDDDSVQRKIQRKIKKIMTIDKADAVIK